ncbi:MAG TPA: carboxypeptidase-like regulatory domain-containing protein, partial [Terriglobales bacterium]|nr:carboxypeptidase-like regulatory domain-containing protein [Terriglobales bacterium]
MKTKTLHSLPLAKLPSKLVWGMAAALSLAILLLPPGARAQVTGATLKGVISDASGAGVPNAKVTATNIATGVATTTSTNASG